VRAGCGASPFPSGRSSVPSSPAADPSLVATIWTHEGPQQRERVPTNDRNLPRSAGSSQLTRTTETQYGLEGWGSNPFERTRTPQLSAPLQTLAALAMLLTPRDSHQSGSGADDLPPSEPGGETVDEIRGRTCAIRMDTLVPPGTIEPADLGSLEVRGGRPALIGALQFSHRSTRAESARRACARVSSNAPSLQRRSADGADAGELQPELQPLGDH
jgi:hypothetical protein